MKSDLCKLPSEWAFFVQVEVINTDLCGDSL